MDDKDFKEELIEKLEEIKEQNKLNAKRKNKILTAICIFLGISTAIQLLLLVPVFQLVLNILSLYF